MYSIDWASLLSRSSPAAGRSAVTPRVHRVVWLLGLTSFFTDVSSEMISSVLPIYLVTHLHLSPLAFGAIDGLYQGFAAFARLGGGFLADRWRNHKAVATFGYGLSAACKLALLAVGSTWSLVAATIAVDRTGKGIRTAPRDAMISLSSERSSLASAFGVHRSLDAAGAVLGPLTAFLIFWFLPDAFDVLFVVSFAIAIVGVGVILLFVNAPQRDAVHSQPVVSLAAAAGLLRPGAFRQLFVVGAMMSVATVSDSFVFLALQRKLEFSTTYFPLLYVGVAGFNSLLAVPAGRLADRRGRWGMFLAGHLVLVLVYLCLLVLGPGWVGLAITLGLFGAYYAATDGVLTAMASAVLPPAMSGSGLALLATATSGARLLASILFGVLWQWRGLDTAIAWFAGILVVAIAFAAMKLTPR